MMSLIIQNAVAYLVVIGIVFMIYDLLTEDSFVFTDEDMDDLLKDDDDL